MLALAPIIPVFDYIYTDSEAVNPTFIRVLRVFRVARIMKLIKSAKGLQALLETVFQSLGQVASVAMLLCIFFFIYACAGVQMFGRLGCTDENPCEGIDKHAHFENWPMAMLTLFRICTGDNGSGIFLDAMRTAPSCDDSESCVTNCCANTPMVLVPFYFMSFTVLAQFIMLNLVVAVLLAQLEEAQEGLRYEEERESIFDLGPGSHQAAPEGPQALAGKDDVVDLRAGQDPVGSEKAFEPTGKAIEAVAGMPVEAVSQSKVTPVGASSLEGSQSGAPKGSGAGSWVRRISRGAFDGIQNARERGTHAARASFLAEHAHDQALCDFVKPDRRPAVATL